MVDNEMAVTEHLEELRRRIIVSSVSVFIATVILYNKILVVINFLMKPIEKFKLNFAYFSLTEGFITRLKVSLFAAIILVSPIIFYEIVAFISPGLTKREKKLLCFGVFYLSIFFLSGVVLGYVIILPYTLKFLITYSNSYMNPLLSGNMYFSFIGLFCTAVGITFIIPLIFLLLAKQKLIEVKTLMKWRKYVLAAVVAVELCFVPSVDLVIFLIIMLPVIVLYEVNIWIFYFREKIINKK